MAYILYPEKSMQEREELLQNQAAKVEMRNYSRSLSDPEVNAERIRYVDDSVTLQRKKEELKNLTATYKDDIKALEALNEERLVTITSRKREQSGKLYGIANQAEKKMMWYDRYGELVDSRELTPDERQGTLFIDTAAGKVEVTPNTSHAALGSGVITDAEIVEDDKPTHDVDRMDYEYLQSVSHDDKGWAILSNDQLMAKYGTTKLNVIKKMVFMPAEDGEPYGKWVLPKKSK